MIRSPDSFLRVFRIELSLELREAVYARTVRNKVNTEFILNHLKLLTFQFYNDDDDDDEEDGEEDFLSSVHFLYRKCSFYLKVMWNCF